MQVTSFCTKSIMQRCATITRQICGNFFTAVVYHCNEQIEYLLTQYKIKDKYIVYSVNRLYESIKRLVDIISNICLKIYGKYVIGTNDKPWFLNELEATDKKS